VAGEHEGSQKSKSYNAPIHPLLPKAGARYQLGKPICQLLKLGGFLAR
jgi:hypothetical protein